MLYHITFRAKDDVAGSTQNFQTTVANFNGEDRVDLCRFEQKPKPPEASQNAFKGLLTSLPKLGRERFGKSPVLIDPRIGGTSLE